MVNTHPAIIPVPRIIERAQGWMKLGTRIVFSHPNLRPLADIVAEEVRLMTGKKMLNAEGEAEPGDLMLKIDNTLNGEAYMVKVGSTASIRGSCYNAIAMGTVSLLQSISMRDNVAKVPRMTVHDKPFVNYRGLMMDVARKWHEPKTIKQAIVLCRWYKIKYLHLHLTDSESCVFPSKAFQHAATLDRHYTRQELHELEDFARNRGVVIIPELETPGHSCALRRALPQLNCTPEGLAMCPGKESTYEILDTLFGEIADVFQSTPYFHIGCDEVDRSGWEKCRDCQTYMQEHSLDNPMELYRHFIVRMNKSVKTHGKKTLVWEGFHKQGKVDIPRDITVMIFECLYNQPHDLIADGYSVINTSWQPLYVVNKRAWLPQDIYDWNLYRWENWFEKSAAYGKGIDVDPTKQVLGAQMCAWEQRDEIELPSLRKRLPAMSERVWNPDANFGFEDFALRLEATDASLTKLLKTANLGLVKSNRHARKIS
jgi:hexosaminidase